MFYQGQRFVYNNEFMCGCVAVWLSSSNDFKVTAGLTEKPGLALAFEAYIQEVSGLNL